LTSVSSKMQRMAYSKNESKKGKFKYPIRRCLNEFFVFH
jgi:hypothetical protein